MLQNNLYEVYHMSTLMKTHIYVQYETVSVELSEMGNYLRCNTGRSYYKLCNYFMLESKFGIDFELFNLNFQCPNHCT